MTKSFIEVTTVTLERSHAIMQIRS